MRLYFITALTFITGLLQARMLPAEVRGEYGEFALFFAWYFTLNSFMHPATLQYTKFGKVELIEKYANYLSCIAPVCILLPLLFVVTGFESYFYLLIPYFFLFYINEFSTVFLYRFGEINAFWNNQIAYFAILLFINAAVLYYFPSVFMLIAAVVLCQVLFAALNVNSVKKHLDREQVQIEVRNFSFKQVKIDVASQINNFVYFVGKSLIYNADKLIVVSLFDTKNYGFYLVLMMFNSAIMPFSGYLIPTYTSQLKECGWGFLKSKFFISVNCTFVVGVGMLYVFCADIIALTIGPQYSVGLMIAKTIILAALFQTYFNVAIEFFMVRHAGRIGLALHAAYVLLLLATITTLKQANVVFDLSLIPVAQALSYAVFTIVIVWFIRRQHNGTPS